MIVAVSSMHLTNATHHPLHCAKWQSNCQKYDRYCTAEGSTENKIWKSCCDAVTYESSGDSSREQVNNTRGLASDIYSIKTGTYSTSLAYCDMTTDGGGWMVILRRADGAESFEKYYKDYEEGFGELNHDFFYGLRALNDLTARDGWELRIDLYNNSNDTESSAHATYDSFTIGCKDEGYALHLGNFVPSETTLKDNLGVFNGQKFVAQSPDDGERRHKCVIGDHKGGWWYLDDRCKDNVGSVLTIPYQILSWYDPEHSAAKRKYGKYELKIRRRNCLSGINSS